MKVYLDELTTSYYKFHMIVMKIRGETNFKKASFIHSNKASFIQIKHSWHNKQVNLIQQ